MPTKTASSLAMVWSIKILPNGDHARAVEQFRATL
jgi:hypothetical protein